MKRWTYLALFAAAVACASLTLNGVMTLQYRTRIDALRASVELLAERIAKMDEPDEGTSTTEVPCPKTGLATTVCTPQKEGEDDAAYAVRHLAKVQAFIDACEDR